tara:strand:+ start:2585 stop:2992 length:408 start_codon:yes stop_codon:yes gene_type:complete
MASEQDAKNAIRKAYIKDQTKFKSAFDHDFTKYKNDLADEFAESERYNKTPKGKAELEQGRKENKERVAASREKEKARQARLKMAGSLFRAISKGVGVLGLAGAVNEARKVHNEIKSKPKGKNGSGQSLLKILTK